MCIGVATLACMMPFTNIRLIIKRNNFIVNKDQNNCNWSCNVTCLTHIAAERILFITWQQLLFNIMNLKASNTEPKPNSTAKIKNKTLTIKFYIQDQARQLTLPCLLNSRLTSHTTVFRIHLTFVFRHIL